MSELRGDFFDRLEAELRAAADRPQPRLGRARATARTAAVAAGVIAVLALALVPVLALLGDGDRATAPAADVLAEPGTVIPAGEGSPPRDVDHLVVATGSAPRAGSWQLETWTSDGVKDPQTGAVYEPPGLPCLGVFLVDSSPDSFKGAGGQCGVMPRTPGFTRVQLEAFPQPQGPKEVLIFGRVPDEATAVVVTSHGDEVVRRATPLDGADGNRYYVVAVTGEIKEGAVNWIGADGRPGSRGIELMPPMTR
jgi:hypothetical protein